MTKKKKPTRDQPSAEPSFEDALARLERIVHELEEGGIGLEQSLARYEEGVKHLKQCHRMLEKAERKIALLRGIDDQGQPITEPLDEEAMTLEEKADRRGRRRSWPGRQPPSGDDNVLPERGDDADSAGELF